MDNRVSLGIKRFFRRRRHGACHAARNTVLATLLLAAVLSVTFISLLEFRLRPVVEQLAARQVNDHVTARLNEALSGLINGELIAVERDGDGRILALSGNMAGLDRIRSRVVEEALNTLGQMDVHTIGVPLGSLFDFDLLWAKGPVVEVHCLVGGTVSTHVRSEFRSAGINQTLHRILLDVEVPLTVLLPGSRCGTVVELTLCAAETVIVGQVPQTYLDFSGGEEHGRETGDLAAAAGAGAGGL